MRVTVEHFQAFTRSFIYQFWMHQCRMNERECACVCVCAQCIAIDLFPSTMQALLFLFAFLFYFFFSSCSFIRSLVCSSFFQHFEKKWNCALNEMFNFCSAVSNRIIHCAHCDVFFAFRSDFFFFFIIILNWKSSHSRSLKLCTEKWTHKIHCSPPHTHNLIWNKHHLLKYAATKCRRNALSLSFNLMIIYGFSCMHLLYCYFVSIKM